MKISSETKIGALTAIAITLLVLGFNFLKGKSFSGKGNKLYAVFTDVKGLSNSNPVVINGKQVGTVYATEFSKDLKNITAVLNMNGTYAIPKNSVAVITASLLGTISLEIKLGDSPALLANNDTISTKASAGIIDEAMQKLDPVLYEVKGAVKSLDSVLVTVNSVVDPAAKNNIRGILDNVNRTMASLAVSSASLQTLLNTQTGALAKSLDNVNKFTGNLAANNEKMNGIMGNVEKATDNFAKLDLQKTLDALNGTMAELKSTIAKVDSDKGTLGLLLNDARLYNNLTATTNKLNLLLDDLRLHPKRYVNVSVFGKKDKSGPLMVPLPDTVNAPYKPPHP
jgi:phospholipid/cholesterol/gamma-HCH transport system substrate-binding protein